MNTDYILQSSASLRQARPAYAQIISFFEKIFTAIHESSLNISLNPIRISDELLEIKKKEQFPLISPSQFVIDFESSTALLKKLCSIAENTDGNVLMSDSAKRILSALETRRIDLQPVYAGLPEGRVEALEHCSADLNIDQNIFAFFCRAGIQPSLNVSAEQLSAYLPDSEWVKGFCPICGSPPYMSFLRGDGERLMSCSLCSHEWQARRIFCPFCENKNSDTLSYISFDEEPEYRVDVCSSCGKYIKTVDTRKIGRVFYTPLEYAATVHLDMKAGEEGYQAGASAFW